MGGLRQRETRRKGLKDRKRKGDRFGERERESM